jgi:polyisoprenoid-binding protein YceI
VTTAALTGDYTLDIARTRIGFVARHTIGPKVRGWFEEFEGRAHLDGDDPAKSNVELTIQAGSIHTRNARRDEMLRGRFLNLAAHPTITFVSTAARQTGATTFEVTGDLTIRGVTKPVTVVLERIGAEHDPQGGVRVRFTGGATINRKDWGVASIAAAGLVGKKVVLEFDVAAVRRISDPSRSE